MSFSAMRNWDIASLLVRLIIRSSTYHLTVIWLPFIMLLNTSKSVCLWDTSMGGTTSTGNEDYYYLIVLDLAEQVNHNHIMGHSIPRQTPTPPCGELGWGWPVLPLRGFVRVEGWWWEASPSRNQTNKINWYEVPQWMFMQWELLRQRSVRGM